MKNIILFGSIFFASGLLMTNVYNSLVDTKSWGSNIPQSIETAKEYFKSVNPGNFYRIFSPVNQVLALLVLILFWKSPGTIRINLAIALVMYISADILTFAYFYPRNGIMLSPSSRADVDVLRNTWKEWNRMNWVRSLIVFTGLIFSFFSLHKIYTLK